MLSIIASPYPLRADQSREALTTFYHPEKKFQGYVFSRVCDFYPSKKNFSKNIVFSRVCDFYQAGKEFFRRILFSVASYFYTSEKKDVYCFQLRLIYLFIYLFFFFLWTR